MKRQDFNFELPDHLIAQRPTTTRDGSQLMSVACDGAAKIESFKSITDWFSGNEILVVNDTRVVPARVQGEKSSGGRIELFFLEQGQAGEIRAMMRGKRLKAGVVLNLPCNVQGTIIAAEGGGIFKIELGNCPDVWRWLEKAGDVPLPPYIKRTPDSGDATRYQTVFASHPGAVAAPTAGLHFTPAILDALRAKGVTIATVTLHVGLGTFMPMRVDAIADHKMHFETYDVPPETQSLLKTGRPIVAVGTTVVRTLESYALNESARQTDLFIYPGFKFQMVDGLLTNFHLPQSTLLMMVSAFAGQDVVMSAYREAIDSNMRFFSYGDAMLLRRKDGKWR
ncbi:MAG: tRNA preQ1(34) S-adenosylmethionine ribosyltransferase-isomerase QueA [Myxococcales bacterium]|nr:tRNA preQ1(34) S-adenosylmethionine ribosyltransferase-isomerase QueA [Myxococcales bacterium]